MSTDVSVVLHRDRRSAAPPSDPDPAPPFDVIVEVRGEADTATAPGLRQELAWALSVAGSHFVFDLSGLTFCDLAGLDALVAAERGLRTQHRSVRWSGESRLVGWLRATFTAAGAVDLSAGPRTTGPGRSDVSDDASAGR